jgi:hypothetical protein
VTTYFICGHLDLSQKEFDKHYVPAIKKALVTRSKEPVVFLVSDTPRGADEMAQSLLAAYLYGGERSEVSMIVYHLHDKPRFMRGAFPTRGGFQTESDRDEAMTAHSDQDIVWVRPGREKSSTARNAARRREMTKSTEKASIG